MDSVAASKRLTNRRMLIDGVFACHDLFISRVASYGGNNVDVAIRALANLCAQPFTKREIASVLQDVPLTVLTETIDLDAGVYIVLTKAGNPSLDELPLVDSIGGARCAAT